MLANEFIRLPYQFTERFAAWVPRWGTEHKDSCAVLTGDPS